MDNDDDANTAGGGGGGQRPAVVKNGELESMDQQWRSKDDCWASNVSADVDFSQRLVFSDEEDITDNRLLLLMLLFLLTTSDVNKYYRNLIIISIIIITFYLIPFSDLTLLFGRREGHLFLSGCSTSWR